MIIRDEAVSGDAAPIAACSIAYNETVTASASLGFFDPTGFATGPVSGLPTK
jgi:hypothetical protein